MAAYILRRLLWLAPALLFISIVTFGLMHAVPGGPWDEDTKLPPATKELLNRKYGLDKPVSRQYLMFLNNAVQGDLGVSFARPDKAVTQIVLSGFKVPAVLGLLALALATTIGVTLGVFSALHRNRLPDYAGVAFASLGSAVPGFVLGVFLIYVFGVKLHWFKNTPSTKP